MRVIWESYDICPFIFVMIIHDYWLFMIVHNSPWFFISLPLQLNQLILDFARHPIFVHHEASRGGLSLKHTGPSGSRVVSKCPSNASKQRPSRRHDARLWAAVHFPLWVISKGCLCLWIWPFCFGRRRGLNKIDLQIDNQDYVTIVSKTGNRKTEKLQKWRLWRLLDSWRMYGSWIKNCSAPRRIWWRFMMVTV